VISLESSENSMVTASASNVNEGSAYPFDVYLEFDDPPFTFVDPSFLSVSGSNYPEPPVGILDLGAFFDVSDSSIFPE
jgi:hypothetical protein